MKASYITINPLSRGLAHCASLFSLYLHILILGKGLRLAVAAVNPFLELVLAHGCNGTQAIPTVFIVRQVSFACFFLAVEAIHHLVLVKAAVIVHLVNDINRAIPAIKVITKEHINMVAINSFRATNVTVGVVHRLAPGLATVIYTTAYTAFRLLNTNVKAVNLDMAFLIVASLFLRISRLGVGRLACLNNGSVFTWFRLRRCQRRTAFVNSTIFL